MKKIAIIGLGYVGLPLAVEFGKKRKVVGFDINSERIDELRKGIDSTLEITSEELEASKNLVFTGDIGDLEDCEIFIVTVPTPIDKHNNPNLDLLRLASEMIGKVISKGAIVIYESTVFPGATEEECVPILEKFSGLIFNKDFTCGYSPERINPGDKQHTLSSVVKVTSGSNEKTAREVDELYSSIISAGTFLVKSIKIAEAAKVIENTQRDLNIALMNELSLIFNKLGIDTTEVLEAANTKWNFLPFTPGLVGGHCIGVDPYYLTYKAQEVGYDPKVILAGRRINDEMAIHVSGQIMDKMKKNLTDLSSARVLMLGLTFKENCPDIRNTKVIDIVSDLENKGIAVDIYDPWVDRSLAKAEYNLDCLEELSNKKQYNAIVLAVAHKQFSEYNRDYLKSFMKEDAIIFDVKSLLPREEVDGRI